MRESDYKAIIASMEEAHWRLKSHSMVLKDLAHQWRRRADENVGIDTSAYLAYERCADDLSELFAE